MLIIKPPTQTELTVTPLFDNTNNVFVNGWEMDIRQKILRKDDAIQQLARLPFALLQLLCAHPGEIVTLSMLKDYIGEPSTLSDRCLEQSAAKLRNRYNIDGIQTIESCGYRIVPACVSMRPTLHPYSTYGINLTFSFVRSQQTSYHSPRLSVKTTDRVYVCNTIFNTASKNFNLKEGDCNIVLTTNCRETPFTEGNHQLLINAIQRSGGDRVLGIFDIDISQENAIILAKKDNLVSVLVPVI